MNEFFGWTIAFWRRVPQPCKGLLLHCDVGLDVRGEQAFDEPVNAAGTVVTSAIRGGLLKCSRHRTLQPKLCLVPGRPLPRKCSRGAARMTPSIPNYA